MTDSNAIWRLTHLVAEEDGPWDLLVHFRAKLGNNVFGRLMDCFYCLSLWFSLPLSIWLASGWVGLILHWQALSGAACLLQRITQKREPVFSGSVVSQGDATCVVVKSEAH